MPHTPVNTLADDSPFAQPGVAKFPKTKTRRSSSTIPTGFYRRKGKLIWHFRKVIDGVLINESTKFTDLKDAIRWAEGRVRAQREGNLGWNPKDVPTVQEYYDKQTRTKYDEWITPFVKVHAKVKITQITSEVCRAWVATRLATETKFGRPFSPGTVRTECGWLRTFFNRAVGARHFLRENPWSAVNPSDKVKFPKKSTRERTLRLDEQAEFLAALAQSNPMVERMARIILGSGLRRQEVCYLRPEDVHHGAIHVPATTGKGGKARTVPVSADVLALIDAQRTARGLTLRSTERLFDIHYTYVGEVFQNACAAAQIIPPVTPHDLRRTYASRMAFKVPPKVLQLLLGHAPSSIKITMEHYAHVEKDELAAIVAKVSNPLEG